MPTIEQYIVLQPPTSAEVAEKALESLKNEGCMFDLIIDNLITLDSPDATPGKSNDSEIHFPEGITFQIQQTRHPVEGGMVISGSETWLPRRERSSYKITTDGQNPAKPAMISIIRH